MKKLFPILVIVAIVVVLVVLSLPQGDEVILNESGKQIQIGIVDNSNQRFGDSAKQSEKQTASNEDEELQPIDGEEKVAVDLERSVKKSVGIKVGNMAPNFRLETFEGEVVELASIGKPVVIDFWAGWCPFCLEELPDLEEASQEFVGVEFLGIHRSETESIERGAEFARERGVTYDLLKDTSGDVYSVYSGGQPFMPVAYFIDENRVIKDRVLGPKTGDKLRESIAKILK